jgi:hypothetical protein
MYAVRNSNGLYFKSYSNSGNKNNIHGTWVQDINKARVYRGAGGARTTITYFGKNYPNTHLPELIKLTVSNVEIIDETARVKKVIDKKTMELVKSQERRAKLDLENADRNYKNAQKELEKAKYSLDRLSK